MLNKWIKTFSFKDKLLSENQLEEHEPDQIHQSEVVETNLSKTVSVVCTSNEKKTKTKSPLGKLFGKKSKTDLKGKI